MHGRILEDGPGWCIYLTRVLRCSTFASDMSGPIHHRLFCIAVIFTLDHNYPLTTEGRTFASPLTLHLASSWCGRATCTRNARGQRVGRDHTLPTTCSLGLERSRPRAFHSPDKYAGADLCILSLRWTLVNHWLLPGLNMDSPSKSSGRRYGRCLA